MVHSVIAVPIFDEMGDSVGVFECLNCDKSAFVNTATKPLLAKFAKYVSLLFYTNGLLKVITFLLLFHIIVHEYELQRFLMPHLIDWPLDRQDYE